MAKILIDDDKTIHLLCRLEIREEGYEVTILERLRGAGELQARTYRPRCWVNESLLRWVSLLGHLESNFPVNYCVNRQMCMIGGVT